jgi:hypothetical protein
MKSIYSSKARRWKYLLTCCFHGNNGAPGEIRTPDRLVRSQVLYPAELRAHLLNGWGLYIKLAEREGFEPSMGINPYSLSRGAPSATRPPLQGTHFNCFYYAPSSDNGRDYYGLPALRPSGQRRFAPLFKIAPGDFVEPSMGINPYSLSRGAPSNFNHTQGINALSLSGKLILTDFTTRLHQVV